MPTDPSKDVAPREETCPTIAEAIAAAPNLPRLDFYNHPQGELSVKIDRKKAVVNLTPSVDCALPLDVRSIPLTEEIDAILAYVNANPDQTLLWPCGDGKRKTQASGKHYLRELWWKAPIRRKLTRAQAAYEIFEAKTYYASLTKEELHRGLFDGGHAPEWHLNAALVGRVTDRKTPEEEYAGSRIALDFAFAPYVKPGDTVEYYTYSPQLDPARGMLFLCATLPADMDPKGAKVEPLFVEDDTYDGDNLDGYYMCDRKGDIVPPERYRIIGGSVAYAPKGRDAFEDERRGIRFHFAPTDGKRATPAEPLKWDRFSGKLRLFDAYDRLTLEQQSKFIRASIGQEYFARHDRLDGEIGIVFKQYPSWIPAGSDLESITVEAVREFPAPGEAFYAAWTVPAQRGGNVYETGLAVVLNDGTVLTRDGDRLPQSEVRPLAAIVKKEYKPSEGPITVSLGDVENVPSTRMKEAA